jgi:hypothetical protein
VLDFVLTSIAVLFLAVAVSGVVTVAGALNDMSAIASECANSACNHAATVTGAQRTRLPSPPITPVVSVSTVDYCVLTLTLDLGTLRAAVDGRQCPLLPVGSRAVVEVWRGTVETVRAPDGVFPTYLNPEVTAFAAAFRLLALLPFGLLVAMIEIDLAHHHLVLRIQHRLRRRRTAALDTSLRKHS